MGLEAVKPAAGKMAAVAVVLLLLPLVQGVAPSAASQSSPSSQPTYVHEDSKLIYIGNGFIELQFQKTNGGIYSIINKATGDDYVTLKQAASLFSFTAGAPTDATFSSGQAASVTYNYTSTPDLSTLQIRSTFQGLYDANTIVTIKVYSNSSLTRWGFTIRNPSGAPIDNIVFPQINGPQRLGATTSDNYILIPDDSGSMLTDPYDSMLVNSTSPGCFGAGDYPSFGAVLQMMAYGDSAGGLYLATYDSGGGVKEYGACRSYIGNPPAPYLSVFVGHKFPETPETDFTIPYDTILGVFTGDWHNAADIYRSWALTQWWTAQGPLSERTDVPAWFKGGYVVLNLVGYVSSSNYDNPDQSATAADIPSIVSAYQDGSPSPLIFQWWGWEKYGAWTNPNVFPPRNGWTAFKQVIDKIHAMGAHVIISLGGGNLDYQEPGFNSTWLSCAIRNPDGSLYSVVDTGKGVAWASPACTSYQSLLINQTVTLEKMGVDGVRLDGMFLNPWDYSTVGGHPPGYGSWYAQDFIQFYKRLVNATRNINPQFLLGNEHLPELFIPFNQIFESDAGILGTNSAVQAWASEVRPTGLFYYVYNDYVRGFSRELHVVPGSDSYPGYQQYLLLAQSLGLTFGENVNFADTAADQHAPASSLTRSLAWASSVAGNYINLGRDLRPPNMTVPSTSIQVGMCVGNPTLELVNYSAPQVIAGAWQAPDSSVELMFVNIGNSSVQVSTSLGYYESLVRGTNLAIVAMSEDRVQQMTAGGSAMLTIPPQKTVVLAVVPANSVDALEQRYLAFKASYTIGSLVDAATATGLDTGGAQAMLLEAKNDFANQNYQQSIELSLQALNATAQTFGRFGISLPGHQVYEESVTALESAIESGNDNAALSAAMNAISVGVDSLKQVFSGVAFDQKLTDMVHLNYTPLTNGFNPNYDQFAAFVDGLGLNITAQTDDSGQGLGKFNVAVLAVPDRPFGSQDVQGYLQFVINGGGLLIIGNGGMPTYVNSLTDHFGIHFTGGTVTASNHLWDAGSFYVTNIDQSNPVTKGVTLLTSNWMSPTSVASNVVVPAWTDSGTNSSSGAKGPFPFIAEATYGSGRVLYVSSMLFDDCCLGGPGTAHLLSNAMAWLSQPSAIANTVLVSSVSPALRVDVGSAQSIGFRFIWATNGSSATGVTAVVNGSAISVGGDGWAWLKASQEKVGLSSFVVQSANCAGGSLRVLLSTGAFPAVIWDRVDVNLRTLVSQLTTGMNATVTWSGYYEYDHTPFTGSVVLNDTTVKDAPGSYTYAVSRINDNRYNLTAFSSNTISVDFVQSSTTSTSSTSSGGGIPEFPFQLLAAAAFTSVVAVSYLLLRRRKVL